MQRSRRLPLAFLLFPLLGALLFVFPESRSSDHGGFVRDDDGPLAGVCVRLKGTRKQTLTDANGRFSLPTEGFRQPLTASKEGYFIGHLTHPLTRTIHLQRLPQEDNPAYEWVDPAPHPAEPHNCAHCHAEIYREWSQSGHSRSAQGRHFRNLYEGTDWHGKPNVGWGLATQYPDGIGVCASCHAPTAHDYDLRHVSGIAAQGVHCDYCHKIAAVAEGPLGLTHGRFNLRLLRPSEGQLFFGPLDDVDRGEDTFSPLYHRSLYCASCHEGVVFGVHVYSTYSEWQASPARREGKQCQDCHQKPTGRMTNFAPGHGGITRAPNTLANHRFFDESQEAMLRRAVKAEVDFEEGSDRIAARVRLHVEGVGHAVPTGFVDRHLALTVEGLSATGQSLVPRTGPKLPAFAGVDGKETPGRLFARILRDFEGHSPVPFWLASSDPPVDTRLVPGKADESVFTFSNELSSLRIRVLYRRFWPQVARSKDWPNTDLVVVDRLIPLTPKNRRP